MSSDEEEIRQLVVTWMNATKAGDVATVLDLMTEDVVFLTPGRAPMRKPDFAAGAAAQAGREMQFDGTSEIQEIQVLGEWAFMWTRLSVVATMPGGAPMMRAGNTLTILRREGGKWRLARDANMLAPVQSPGAK